MTAAKTRPARQRKSLDASQAKQIESFLAKYTPEMVRAGKQSRARLTLCFLKGAKLSDPKKLLRGGGNIVRNIHLTSPAQIDEPDVMDLVQQAIAAAAPPFPGDGTGLRTIIKSISAKQRPRRPR